MHKNQKFGSINQNYILLHWPGLFYFILTWCTKITKTGIKTYTFGIYIYICVYIYIYIYTKNDKNTTKLLKL